MKQMYEAPEVQVINMEVQGVIASSPTSDSPAFPYGGDA